MIARRAILARPVPSFGRRMLARSEPQTAGTNNIGDDLRLFALTFAGGFLFMSVYLA